MSDAAAAKARGGIASAGAGVSDSDAAGAFNDDDVDAGDERDEGTRLGKRPGRDLMEQRSGPRFGAAPLPGGARGWSSAGDSSDFGWSSGAETLAESAGKFIFLLTVS